VEVSVIGGEESQKAMVAGVVKWMGYAMLKGKQKEDILLSLIWICIFVIVSFN